MYVHSTIKVILSYNVVFDKSFSSALSYTSQLYAEGMVMRPIVTYTPYATSSKEQTGGVITFAQFEEGNLKSETRNNTESDDTSNSESIMMSEKDMEDLDETEKFDDDLISRETLHDIRDGNQTHPKLNKREARMECLYVRSTIKVISSYDVMVDESFSSALSYTSQPYAEAMAMRPVVTYNPYATSSKEQTGDVITFAQFEEGNLLSETCNDTESGDESDS